MKIHIVLSTGLFLLFNLGQAQGIKKFVIDEKDLVSGYYLAVEPASPKISNVLVLLPGYAQSAESIFPESKLHNVAYVNNVLVIAVAEGPKIYADSVLVPKLNRVLIDVMKRYAVAADQFVIGGYSAGGTIALRYAELCHESPNLYPIKPKGVFTVDSPVDIIDLWGYFEREIARNYSEVGVNEAKFATRIMTQEHGTPKNNLAEYKKLTPFYKDQIEPGNERFLKNTALRVYHDVDVSWYLKERRRSIFDANYANSSDLINQLLLQGSQKAEFIQSDRKGYRSNGTRHPHSWSIVDEVECVRWINSLSSSAYAYITPPNWRKEVENFPLDFAPQLPYKGTADLRFAPGWEQIESDEFWSYTALWWLEGNPVTNATTLRRDLEAYYTGLVNVNVANKQTNASQLPKTKVTVNAVSPTQGNASSFTGVISTYDVFMTNKPIELNFRASVKDCQKGRKALFFEISPQAQNKPIWQVLDGLQQKFSCQASL